ncbi:hypothetical protein BC940DRAFT_313738 [Gongronella butleri]|nr:hypothetical protein BC940DRAFT_313738 [Gongronella butleri]
MPGQDDTHDDKASFQLNRHSNAPSQAPHAHRCNNHLEDVLKGLSSWPLDVSQPFHRFLDCLKSQPGNEPPRYDPSSPSASS